ncbi:MAG: cytochrome c oxidase subunit 3 [Gallionellales bacterium 35-53-114]|jgi:cytochrome c oxidase subunit 3|nr:MAG: cytochrome c oxidase subunit 3 [Gallionellales bacterium 35-53-114]OYZ62476.1 MAG: cytochrome c oxidase subunit 3 [Gallionellales bacterium 24-53-125]OZB08536.1 MAG: cytochrome c oxidase subunit 3 [Gallionellales bacterium 39-52-133]HQS59504.1 cytochrome c oxidase subunit 3 [Gallionellaceae bacterium]HQS76417.1 cytochrome c oxidase subunit 3 [Gallionellaceae bacterium]
MSGNKDSYYLPSPSYWPIVGSLALLVMATGFILMLNKSGAGGMTLLAGVGILLFMMYGWFGDVIRESESGMYNKQVDKSFRLGMSWFILSEVAFFAAFFGALFYARILSVPWLGSGDTMAQLWPQFVAAWPGTAVDGQLVSGPGDMPKFTPMGAWGIPAINTLLLLTSGATLTWAHWGLIKNNRSQLVWGMIMTIALAIAFISLQAYEYYHAYHELGLTMGAGIYGATFFMLTGFHGFHVMLGTTMLAVILVRSMKGHFKPDAHFGFEGVAWYWHFVDVVWLGLFVFVYWI